MIKFNRAKQLIGSTVFFNGYLNRRTWANHPIIITKVEPDKLCGPSVFFKFANSKKTYQCALIEISENKLPQGPFKIVAETEEHKRIALAKDIPTYELAKASFAAIKKMHGKKQYLGSSVTALNYICLYDRRGNYIA